MLVSVESMHWSDIELSQAGSVPRRVRASFPLVRLSLRNFVQRILFLGFLFASELIVLSVWLDGASLVQRTGLIGIMGDWGAWILRCIVGFAAIFLTFAYLKNKTALERISGQIEQSPMRWGLFAAHCCAMGIFVFLSFLALRGWRIGFLGQSTCRKLVCCRDFSDCVCRIRISIMDDLGGVDPQHRSSVGLCIDGCRFSLPRRQHAPRAVAAGQLPDVPPHQNVPESLCFWRYREPGDNCPLARSASRWRLHRSALV